MYIVVSHWEPLPGKEAEFAAAAPLVRQQLRLQPGVQLVEAFANAAGETVLVIYRDREVYDRIVVDADSPFGYIARMHNLGEIAREVSTDAGEAFVDE